MDMLISVTKHLPATSPTLWGPINVKAPRMFHLPSVWRELGEGLLQGFVPLMFWPGGALDLGRETSCLDCWSALELGVKGGDATAEGPQIP